MAHCVLEHARNAQSCSKSSLLAPSLRKDQSSGKKQACVQENMQWRLADAISSMIRIVTLLQQTARVNAVLPTACAYRKPSPITNFLQPGKRRKLLSSVGLAQKAIYRFEWKADCLTSPMFATNITKKLLASYVMWNQSCISWCKYSLKQANGK